jgi:hypothetical protein
MKGGVVECPLSIHEGTQCNLLVIKGLFQSMNNLEESCFCRHTCPIGKLVLMKWFFSTRTPPLICLSINFSSVLSIKDMRLIVRRDFAWDISFLGLGIYTTLMCLQLMGIYPKAKLALSSIRSLPASSSNPCCSMMCIIPSMPGDL